MAEEPKAEKISLEELMVSTLAMTDATVKLLIARACLPMTISKRSSAVGAKT